MYSQKNWINCQIKSRKKTKNKSKSLLQNIILLIIIIWYLVRNFYVLKLKSVLLGVWLGVWRFVSRGVTICNEGGREGVKNWPKLRYVLYGRPLRKMSIVGWINSGQPIRFPLESTDTKTGLDGRSRQHIP
jgi:hypothetical protein